MKKWIKKASLVGFVIGTPIIGLSVGINTISQNVTQKTTKIPVPFHYQSPWVDGTGGQIIKKYSATYTMPKNFLNYKLLVLSENLTLSKWGTSNYYTKDYSISFTISSIINKTQERYTQLRNFAGFAHQEMKNITILSYNKTTNKLTIKYIDTIESYLATTQARGSFDAKVITLS